MHHKIIFLTETCFSKKDELKTMLLDLHVSYFRYQNIIRNPDLKCLVVSTTRTIRNDVSGSNWTSQQVPGRKLVYHFQPRPLPTLRKKVPQKKLPAWSVLMHIAGFLRKGRAGETAAGNQGGGKKKTEEEEGLSSSADGTKQLNTCVWRTQKGSKFF